MKKTLLTLSVGLSLFVASAQQDEQAFDTTAGLPVLEGFSEEPTHVVGNTIEIVTALPETTPDILSDFTSQEQPEALDITSIPLPAANAQPEPVTLFSTQVLPIEDTSALPLQKPSEVSVGGDIGGLLSRGNYVQWLGVKSRLRSPKAVRKLYQQMDYQPLWTQDGIITPLAESVIKSTLSAWQHALRPEVYHTKVTEALTAGEAVSQPAKFDVLLTDAFITYKKHLANGIVNPRRQFASWNQKPEKPNFLALYQQAANAGDASQIFVVNNVDYRSLQKAYIKALGNKVETPKKAAKVQAKRLRPGNKGAAVVALRQRLGLPIDSDVYDKSVKTAVKKYQKQHGLGADGFAGPRTLRLINGSALGGNKKTANKLAINMERMRWQRPTPRGNYVWVNIPAFRMAIRNGKKHLFQSNVIVGRTARKTPIFSDVLEHIVLAPYWNVPSTIFKEDKLPRLRKNPNALGKNMQVVSRSTGKVVSPGSVDWSKGGTGYRLRQLPGPRNSLGYMKFLFPNHHAIYLHDTPNRRLFKKKRRAFSSGCVRVERAEDLAVFLLKDMGYNRKRIKRESRRKSERWLNLSKNKRYPVFLDYYTAWVDENGKVRYSSDVYHYDARLSTMYKSALKKL